MARYLYCDLTDLHEAHPNLGQERSRQYIDTDSLDYVGVLASDWNYYKVVGFSQLYDVHGLNASNRNALKIIANRNESTDEADVDQVVLLNWDSLSDFVSEDGDAWYYDSDNDTLHIRLSNVINGLAEGISDNTLELRIEEDWDSFRVNKIKEACDYVDSRLRSVFPVPLPYPVDPNFADSVGKGLLVDSPIRRATALYAASLIVRATDPVMGLSLRDESEVLIGGYLDGSMRMSWEPTKNKWSVISKPSTTDVDIQFNGEYLGETRVVRVKITTGGAIGTAKYKISFDNGVTYQDSEYFTQEYFNEVFEGLNIRFYYTDSSAKGSLTVDETWVVKLTGKEQTGRSKIYSRTVTQ